MSRYEPEIPGLSKFDDVILFALATISIAVLIGFAVWGSIELAAWLVAL